MILDTSLRNTQQYKVCIKGKVEKSRERSSALQHLGVVAIEKGAFDYGCDSLVINLLYIQPLCHTMLFCRVLLPGFVEKACTILFTLGINVQIRNTVYSK